MVFPVRMSGAIDSRRDEREVDRWNQPWCRRERIARLDDSYRSCHVCLRRCDEQMTDGFGNVSMFYRRGKWPSSDLTQAISISPFLTHLYPGHHPQLARCQSRHRQTLYTTFWTPIPPPILFALPPRSLPPRALTQNSPSDYHPLRRTLFSGLYPRGSRSSLSYFQKACIFSGAC